MSDLTIEQGKTFSRALRWETKPVVYKQITGATQTAPLRLTVATHGAPNGWRCAVTNMKGMDEINATANAVKAKDYHQATVIDANTIEFNDVNAAGFKAYTSGGILQYNTPVSLAGFTARMSIKDKIGGTELLLTTENDRIDIDDAAKTITLTISATDTAAITWKKAVYELEMVSATGEVTSLIRGNIAVTKEVAV